MTQKELLYVEDACKHEMNIINICQSIKSNLEDLTLINFIDKEIKKHESMHEKLINLLEEKTNE